ncbi:unnamed protein product [Peronospora destructor]|uniref:Uncharacterized protein n=1 Tax=Peronospora destructor TaxID=86335 RepID=A0AAV0SZY9_9STRA|nr:unnamed protein product [Peronospora destructor]
MTDDRPMRSKQLELFGKMHVGMDHVLAKLLQDAPPLPDSLKLQTETQSLRSTWLQVTETFEKRKFMLQRRREKEKRKGKNREEAVITTKTKKQKIKEKDLKNSAELRKIKNQSSYDSLQTIKRFTSVTMDKKSVKKKMTTVTMSPCSQKLETDVAVGKEKGALNAHDRSILKKLRELPLWKNVVHDTNKFRAVIKWMELDKGENAAMSTELTKLLEKLQLEAALEKKNKPKLSRKRSLEMLGDASQMQEKTSKPKYLTEDRKQGPKQPRSSVDENEGVCDLERERKKEIESSEGSSESDEAEFVLELHNSPPSPAKPDKSGEMQPLKRQKQV